MSLVCSIINGNIINSGRPNQPLEMPSLDVEVKHVCDSTFLDNMGHYG